MGKKQYGNTYGFPAFQQVVNLTQNKQNSNNTMILLFNSQTGEKRKFDCVLYWRGETDTFIQCGWEHKEPPPEFSGVKSVPGPWTERAEKRHPVPHRYVAGFLSKGTSVRALIWGSTP